MKLFLLSNLALYFFIATKDGICFAKKTTNSYLVGHDHYRTLQQGGQGQQQQGGQGQQKTFTTSGLSVKILGQSGKFIASNENSQVQVTMDGLYERDENGNLVGNTGSTKHSINTFATTDFTFDAEETVQLLEVTDDDLDGNITEVSAQGLRVDFYTTLDTGSKLLVQAHLVSKAGLAGDDGGNWTVSPGDFKFNIELSDWNWCDPCSTDQYGAFVDLDIEVKTLSSDSTPVLKKEHGSNQTTFDLGDGGATLELSNTFMVRNKSTGNGTNAVTFMPEGYPKITTSGEKTLFTFRFNKFDKDSTAKYDPIIKFSSSSDSSTTSDATTARTRGKGSLFGVVLGLVSGILTYYNIF